MMKTTIFMIFSIAFLAGLVFLQIYLSKQESKWLGLILPIILFIFALIGGVGNVLIQDNATLLEILSIIIPITLLLLIPFFASMVIYYICRTKLTSQSEINKMKIRDL